MFDFSEITITTKDGVKVTFDAERGTTIHDDSRPLEPKELEYLSCLYMVLFPSSIT